jgi:hypothetical protein
MTTNPAPCALPDGSVLLIYKSVSRRGDLLRLGVARAPHPEGPYERVCDTPILARDETGDHLEDPFVWLGPDGLLHMAAKDMAGGYCGERGAGVLATSQDGVSWSLAEQPLAYRRKIVFEDGAEITPAYLERPQMLVEEGKPKALFLAVGLSKSPEVRSHALLEDSFCLALAAGPEGCPDGADAARMFGNHENQEHNRKDRGR